MNNKEFHFTCITHIFYDFNNIQQISPLRGNSFKEEVHPKPKLGMFCALPQNNQHRFEKWYKYPETNCLETWKLHKILVGQGVIWINQIKSITSSSWVIDQNTIYHDLIKYSRTTYPTEILMSFLNLTDNLLQDAYIVFFFKNVSIILRCYKWQWLKTTYKLSFLVW